MGTYTRNRWSLRHVIIYLLDFAETRMAREWRREYLHPFLHIFSHCQESIPRWTIFIPKGQTTLSGDWTTNNELSGIIGVEIFSRMVIATTEYSDDETSPVFELM